MLFREGVTAGDGHRFDGVVRPGRAGRGDARSRAACTTLLGDLVEAFVRVVDATSGLVSLVGNWVGCSV